MKLSGSEAVIYLFTMPQKGGGDVNNSKVQLNAERKVSSIYHDGESWAWMSNCIRSRGTLGW